MQNIQNEIFKDFSNGKHYHSISRAVCINHITEFIPVAFQNSNDSAYSGTAADAEWAALYPPDGGFIQTKLSNFTVQLSVTTFHAIHCLNTLRQVAEVFFDVASSETSALVTNGTAGGFFHMQHCLVYLRQMVMCSSDPALEHDILLPNGTTTHLGDGTVHTCRNFDELSSRSVKLV
jgi:hypothetical protein